MPRKPIVREARVDFSGGLNISAPIDALNSNELRETTNVRIEPHGGLLRRLGSRKLNATALDSPVRGIYQWLVPSTGNMILVAVTSTSLYTSAYPYSTFDLIVDDDTYLESLTGDGGSCDFALMNDSSFGGFQQVLYIASEGHISRFDGTVGWAEVDTDGAPPATAIRQFGNRLFANSVNDPNTLFWSRIGNGSHFTPAGLSDGGFALVGNDAINSLENSGASLLLGTHNSTSRFSGIGAEIQILTDTMGVSADIGPLAVGAFVRAEQFAILYSNRGPYLVTEGGLLFIGDKIFTTSPSDITITPIMPPIIAHNRRRKELWFAYVPQDATGQIGRTSVIVYNYQLQCWYGRFKYPFNITSMAVFEDELGNEGIVAGCEDGFVRSLDDVAAGTLDDDGTEFVATVQFAPFGLDSGPYNLKTLEHIYLQVLGLAPFSVNIIGDLGASEAAALVT